MGLIEQFASLLKGLFILIMIGLVVAVVFCVTFLWNTVKGLLPRKVKREFSREVSQIVGDKHTKDKHVQEQTRHSLSDWEESQSSED